MPDTLCCLIAIHIWHLDIHKYQIISSWWHLLYPVHALNSIFHTLDNKPGFFQNRHCNFRIQIIILRQQNMLSTQTFSHIRCFYFFFPLAVIFLVRYFMHQCKRKYGSFSQFTFHFKTAAHQIDHFLYDWHSKTGSSDSSSGCIPFTTEWFK